jgi:hypothetical protein
MTKFLVYSSGSLVGQSALECGDPPMGVAVGEFIPNAAYVSIKPRCTSNHADQSALALSVRSESGAEIPCIGVSILDYSSRSEGAYIELNVIGIDSGLYSSFFPHHVAAYEKRFNVR